MTKIEILFAECLDGKHALETIYTQNFGGPYDEKEVVKWCNVCGSIVIDNEYDGRVYPGGLMPVKGPASYSLVKMYVYSDEKPHSFVPYKPYDTECKYCKLCGFKKSDAIHDMRDVK